MRRRRRSLAVLALIGVGFLALSTQVSGAAFNALSFNQNDNWETKPYFRYGDQVVADGPYLYWRLNETGTTATAADSSGNGRAGSYRTNGSGTYFTRLVGGGAITSDATLTPAIANNAVTLTANANACITTAAGASFTPPTATTVSAWFKIPTTQTAGGKIVGFEKPQTGVAVPSTGTYDRHLYMDASGYVWFGVYNGAMFTVRSDAVLDNNVWHMAAATVGPTGGTRLYVDGVLQADTDANTAGESTTGWWRAGCGNLAGWGASWNGANSPGTSTTVTFNKPFSGGSIDEVAVFHRELSAAEITALWSLR